MKAVFLKGLCGMSLAVVPEVVLASSKGNLKSVSSHQYTHLIETYQSQTFEPLSQTALFLEQSASVSSFPKVAKVYFITNDKGQVFSGIGSGNGGGMEFEDPTAEQCKGEGYKITSCENGNPADVCPHNSSYFKECCDAKYAYTEENCKSPNTLSADTCGGKYKCECETALFPVTETSCASPLVPNKSSGSSCVAYGETRYMECICPQSYGQTCSGKHMKGTGTGCNKNGETKYTSCECESKYTLTCSGNNSYPTNSNDFCELNGVKYFAECGVCPNACTISEANKQPGIIYEYEECSNKYCEIGCAINYVSWCVKPETDCSKLGYTKSVSQCPDGYLKCPHNSVAVYCRD